MPDDYLLANPPSMAAMLAAIIESSEDAVIGKSLEGIVLSWNRAAEQLFGYTAGEAIGKPISFLAPVERRDEMPGILAAINRGERIEHFETERICKDGRRIFVSLSVSPIRDEHGRIVGAAKIARDITASRLAREEIAAANRALQVTNEELEVANEELEVAEEELRQHNDDLMVTRLAVEIERRRYQELFELAPDGYLVTDLHGNAIEANRAAAEQFGVPPGELTGCPFTRYLPPERRRAFRARLRHLVAKGGARSWELPLCPPGREPFDAAVAVTVMRDRDGRPTGLRWLVRDVTERRRAETERAHLLASEQAARARAEAAEQRSALLYREAEQANAAKDRFLATLSHELRTPLTPVLALVSSLEREPGLPPRAAGALVRMRRNIELEARLIDDLLDLTRIARGKLELKREVADLAQIVEHAVETCCGADQGGPRPPIVRRLAALDNRLWGDAPRLTQVFWNLLTNACKFTPPEGTITVSSRREEGPAGADLVVEVADTGLGIEPELLPTVFDAFEQGRPGISRQFGGLGLGLAVSKAIVELHGGTISAASQGRGHGATFTVRLPVGELPAGAQPAGVEAAASPGADRRLHILLVEDHVDTAEVMAELLGDLGHRVTAVGTVAEALAAAHEAGSEAEPIDLVVSDLGLPDGSGQELMRELAHRWGLKGIALSGYGMEDDVQKSREAGFALHLTKPIDLQALVAAIRTTAG